MKKHLFYLALIVFLFAACKKNEQKPPSPDFSRSVSSFENNTDKRITVNIYPTTYLPGDTRLTIAVQSFIIEPQSTAQIPPNSIAAGKFYYDWYSEDFLLSGWNDYAGEISLPFRYFDYHPQGKGKLSLAAIPNRDRLTCLSGNGKATIWQAVDAYNKQGISVWDTLSQNAKKHKLKLTLDHTIEDSTLQYQFATAMGAGADLSFVPPSKRFNIMATDRTKLGMHGHAKTVLVLTNIVDFISSLYTSSHDTLYYYVVRRDSVNHYQEPVYMFVKTEVQY